MRRLPSRRLSVRLFCVFVLLLAIFAMVQQVTYQISLRSFFIRDYSSTMLRNAYAVSQNIYDLFVPDSRGAQDDRFPVSAQTLAPYMAMVEQMTRCDLYLVDDAHRVTTYADGVVETITRHTFPGYIEQTIALGFMGKTPVADNTLNGGHALCACAPIMNANGRVLGVVLLTAQPSELSYLQRSFLPVMLVSLTVAALLSVMTGIAMSWVLSRPLLRMDRFALQLSGGEYDLRLKNLRRKDELGSLNHSMNVLAEQLQESRRKEADLQQRQQEFFSNISHELKTPVTVIRGSLEALHDGVVSPEKRDAYYTRTLLQIDSLDRLVRDMLQLSRLRSLNFRLSMAEISLTDLIGETAMTAAGLCERKNITLECMPPEKDWHFQGDMSRLRQMLMTVLDNAVKYTPSGEKVALQVISGVHPVIVIRDGGPGIPPQVMERLFDRWYSTGQYTGEGTGLGLTIAREIAIRHNIDIQVETDAIRGTTFRFILSDLEG